MSSRRSISSMCYKAKGKLFLGRWGLNYTFRFFFYLEQELHMIESEVSWDALYILKKNKLWELL